MTKSLDDVNKYVDSLGIDDITDYDSILKSFKTQKGLAAKGKYSEAHDIFVNTLAKQATERCVQC